MLVDKTILSLATILIGGTGVIGSLVSYNPPELNQTYFDLNPFAVKKAAIDARLRRAFVILALAGLAIQAIPILYVDFPDQEYTLYVYVSFLVVGVVVMGGMAVLIRKVAIRRARRSWLPELREEMRDMYELSKSIAENDGWRSDQIQQKEQFRDPEAYRQANFDSVDTNVSTMQRVFEVPDVNGGRKEKLATLRKIFESNA